MDLFMPKDTDKDEELNKAKQSGALTIMLGKDNTVYYYEGELAPDASNFKSSTFKDIREIIMNKKKDVISRYVTDAACEEEKRKATKDPNDCRQKDLVIVIKPTDEATYKNTVDILDEMKINDVHRFAMVDISPVEIELVKKTQEAAGIK
jgi:hypothetical protein